jgi:thymidine phosphorylase
VDDLASAYGIKDEATLAAIDQFLGELVGNAVDVYTH